MSKRLEDAIESIIYWKNAYTDSRDKFNKTGNPKYNARMNANFIHVLSSAEWLKQVYEEESRKKVTVIGNLPEIDILNES